MKELSKLKKLRPLLVVAIIALTIGAFVYYFRRHPQYLTELFSINFLVILLLMFVNVALISTVALMNHTATRMCQVELGKRESLLLTIYSSLANFFGPLQSGPGVRAGYLKTRYHIRIRDFTFVTLIGYGFYAVISALFLVIGVMKWWVSVLAVLAASLVAFGVIKWFATKNERKKSNVILSARNMGILGAATFVQVTLMSVRYGIELVAVGAHVTLGQIISYTGAANFSLFVSITPDGIGIREAFLLFAQRLHGVPTHDIVAASLIDRASYVVFLAILGIVAVVLHAHKRFSGKASDEKH